MADVDSVVYTTTERKVRKVKKTTKRRESHDQNAEVTITEVDSTQNNHHAIEEYVLAADLTRIGPKPHVLGTSPPPCFSLSRHAFRLRSQLSRSEILAIASRQLSNER